MTDTQNNNITPPTLPAGWYPTPNMHGYQSYWDGNTWIGEPALIQPIAPQAAQNISQPIIYQQQPIIATNNKPVYLSGLTTGQNILWLIASIFTAGLAIPFWWFTAKMKRKRIK